MAQIKQTNTFNLKSGMMLSIGGGIFYTIKTVHGNFVRLECQEPNRYGFKDVQSHSLAQMGKALINGSFKIA